MNKIIKNADLFLKWLLFGISSLAVIFVVIFLYFAIVPQLESKVQQPIEIVNNEKPFGKGDTILLKVQSCSSISYNGNATIELLAQGTDTALIEFNNIKTNSSEEGCPNYQGFEIPVTTDLIPTIFNSGKYQLQIRVSYKINFAKTVEELYVSEPFDYIKK